MVIRRLFADASALFEQTVAASEQDDNREDSDGNNQNLNFFSLVIHCGIFHQLLLFLFVEFHSELFIFCHLRREL